MPPKKTIHQLGSPEDWLRHARSDLAIACHAIAPDILYETLCFHTQQAVEKSLKAVLVAKGIEIPDTHSIARLITAINEVNVDWPEEMNAVAELSEYALQIRYPGMLRDVSKKDYEFALELAKRVMAWAKNIIT